MQTGKSAAVGHLAGGHQAVRGQGGGAGGSVLVEMGIQSAIVVKGGAQQKGAVWVRRHRTERLLRTSCRFTGVREVTTAVGS